MNERNDVIIKSSLKIIIPVIIVIIIFAGLVNVGVITTKPLSQTSEEITAIVKINFGDGTILSYDITTKNATVYQLLLEAANIGKFEVETKYYASFDSIVVESIGSFESGQDNKYWLYYINGESGAISADKQFVKNGDIIEWSYEGF